jgi:hypothetical protein
MKLTRDKFSFKNRLAVFQASGGAEPLNLEPLNLGYLNVEPRTSETYFDITLNGEP